MAQVSLLIIYPRALKATAILLWQQAHVAGWLRLNTQAGLGSEAETRWLCCWISII